MPNVQYSNEILSSYLKKGFTVQSDNDEAVILVKRRKVGIFWNLVFTFLTGGAWLLIWIPRLIFRNSAVTLYKGFQSERSVERSSQLLDLIVDKFQGLSSRNKLVAAGALCLALIVLVSASNISQTIQDAEAKGADYSTYKLELETTIDKPTCSLVAQVLRSGATASFATKNLERATRAAKNLTPWNATDYLASNSWITVASQLSSKLEQELEAVTNPVLTTRIRSLKDAPAENDVQPLGNAWGDRFRSFVVSDCGQAKTLISANTKIAQVYGAAKEIQNKAAAKPWYPKDFKETGIEGFAYKNISNQGCTYSFGSCAKFKIVSRTDCPSNLYVRTNHLVNGEVDDWSNDTATVTAGQVAIMETTFSSDKAGAWQFVEITCY